MKLLFLLWLLLSGKHGGSGLPYQARRSQPRRPPPGPHDSYTAPSKGVPVSYGGGGGSSRWKVYKPLTPEVIARAQVILNDPSAHEVIEPDPSKPGQMVRYLRTSDGTHTHVTAWLPRTPGAGLVNV